MPMIQTKPKLNPHSFEPSSICPILYLCQLQFVIGRQSKGKWKMTVIEEGVKHCTILILWKVLRSQSERMKQFNKFTAI